MYELAAAELTGGFHARHWRRGVGSAAQGSEERWGIMEALRGECVLMHGE